MTKLYDTKYQKGDVFLFQAQVTSIDNRDGNIRNYCLEFETGLEMWLTAEQIDQYNRQSADQKKERLQKEMARLQEQLKLKEQEYNSL